MGKVLLSLGMVVISGFCSAQTDSVKNNYVGIAYFSEGGFYPGFTFIAERSLLSNRNFELMAAARLGTYFHYRNQTGIFLMVQSGQRIRLYRQLYFEHYVGVGYLHTFLNGGDAYYVDATGTIRKNSNTGTPHFMPSVSFGLGFNTHIEKHACRFFARPIVFWMIPFNQTSLVQFGLEMGGIIKLAQ
ncbi:MAG TPA: hypothetical protein VK658_09125 [Chryseolinea sp.]|nr:hypothetical protein [Chryseolinea sp.]